MSWSSYDECTRCCDVDIEKLKAENKKLRELLRWSISIVTYLDNKTFEDHTRFINEAEEVLK